MDGVEFPSFGSSDKTLPWKMWRFNCATSIEVWPVLSVLRWSWVQGPFQQQHIQHKIRQKKLGIWTKFGKLLVLGRGTKRRRLTHNLIPSKSMKAIGMWVWFHDEDPESYKMLEDKHDKSVKSSNFIENILEKTGFGLTQFDPHLFQPRLGPEFPARCPWYTWGSSLLHACSLRP